MTVYARDVVSKRRPAAHRQVQACRRHLRDLDRQRTVAFPYYFDAQEADDRIAFFAHLRHSKGREWAGLPLVLAPFQQFIIGSTFGWKRTSDDVRRFTNTYIQTPKKQGKSTTAAGVGINLAFFDGESGADVPCAATKKDQARIVFGEALRMVRRSPHLSKRLKWLTNSIYNETTNSKLEPIGSDEDTLDGINPSGAIIDELHAHKTRGVVDQIEESCGTRFQPLIFTITTPGFDRSSICYEKYSYACAVLDRLIDDESLFVFIADCDEGDDWQVPRNWAKANPGLGLVGQWLWQKWTADRCLAELDQLRTLALVQAEGRPQIADRLVAQQVGGSVKLRDLVSRAQKASFSPAAQNTFRRFRLGLWTEQAVRAIDMAVWDECAGPRTWQQMRASLAGRKAYAGIDLATTQDIAGLCWVLEAEDDPEAYDLVPDLFIPEKRIAARAERQRIEAFVAQGALQTTEGNKIDTKAIRRRMREVRDQLADLREAGFDPWNAHDFSQACQDEDGFVMLEVRQGMITMSEPTKKFLDLVADRKIRHGGHPTLRWMASNLAVRTDGNENMKPDKQRSAEKIDGIVAAIIGLACAIRAAPPKKRKESVYKTRGAYVVTAEGASPLLPTEGETP